MQENLEQKTGAAEVTVDKSADRLLAGFEEETQAIAEPPARGKRMLLGGLVFLILIGAAGLWIMASVMGGKEVKNQAKPGQMKGEESGANSHSVTEDAIKSMREVVTGPRTQVQPPPGGASSTGMAAGQVSGATNVFQPQPNLAATVPPPGFGGKGKESLTAGGTAITPTAGKSEATETPANVVRPQAQRSEAVSRNPEHSIYFRDPLSETRKAAEAETRRQREVGQAAKEHPLGNPPKPVPVVRRGATAVPALERKGVPMFGAMLPVETMGVIYTLRSGSLVRMQLMRDLRGEGWQLKRGTVFVGQTQSALYDRAFIQVLGYINPETGGLVRLGGETLGSDGGAGIKGKQRKVSRNWSRVLDRLATNSIQALSNIFGRGNQVILATNPQDIYRSTGVMGERRETLKDFVEVQAGSVGFILVTDLPPAESSITGTRQIAANSSQEEGSGDSDLAYLLEQDDPAAALREALPRLTGEARRAAEQILRVIETDQSRAGK